MFLGLTLKLLLFSIHLLIPVPIYGLPLGQHCNVYIRLTEAIIIILVTIEITTGNDMHPEILLFAGIDYIDNVKFLILHMMAPDLHRCELLAFNFIFIAVLASLLKKVFLCKYRNLDCLIVPVIEVLIRIDSSCNILSYGTLYLHPLFHYRVYEHCLLILTHHYNPTLYPKLFCLVVANFMTHTYNVDFSQRKHRRGLDLIKSSLDTFYQCYDNKCRSSLIIYDETTQAKWKSIDKYFFKNDTFAIIMIQHYILIKLGLDSRRHRDKLQRFHRQCFKQFFADSHRYSLYDEMEKSPNWSIILIIENITDCINYPMSKVEIKLVVSLLNRFCSMFLRNDMSLFCDKHHCAVWYTLGKLHLYQKLDANRAILCFKMSLTLIYKNMKINGINFGLLSNCVCNRYELRYYLLCLYFINANWDEFEKHSKKRRKMLHNHRRMRNNHNQNTFVKQMKVDKIAKDIFNNKNYQLFNYYCGLTKKQRRQVVMSNQTKIDCLQMCLKEKTKESQILEVLSCNWVKNRIILSNIVSIKQCNWKHCHRKDVILKLCKKCRSVYYCSKLCQKKDWNIATNGNQSHKDHCQYSSKRMYKLTLKKQYKYCC